MSRPPFIVQEADVPEERWSYPGSTELLAFGRPIGRLAGLERSGVHVERIPPGVRLSWPHAEEDEEEWAYVIEGSPSVWIDGIVHVLKAGDFVAFPAGAGVCHTFINDSEVDAKLLVGGEASKPANRIFYPLDPSRREQMGERYWPLESTWVAQGAMTANRSRVHSG